MEGAKVFGKIADMDERADGHERKNSNICSEPVQAVASSGTSERCKGTAPKVARQMEDT
jgi:hypothetical protein